MTGTDARPQRSSLRAWDLVLLTGSLALVVGLAWAYLFYLAAGMSDMSEMSMSHAGVHRWGLEDYAFMFAMWTIMMIGMMVPTAARAVLIYARLAGTSSGTTIAATHWFVLGYVLVWSAFSIVATLMQAGLEELALLSPAMASSSPFLGAGLLIGAGVYQLTPWKDTCLRHCQSPAMYLAGRFGPGARHGVALGIGHGGYCLGCCWALMCLLLVGGVMNLLWIAAITGFVLLEKLLQPRFGVTPISALLMIGAGLAFLYAGST